MLRCGQWRLRNGASVWVSPGLRRAKRPGDVGGWGQTAPKAAAATAAGAGWGDETCAVSEANGQCSRASGRRGLSRGANAQTRVGTMGATLMILSRNQHGNFAQPQGAPGLWRQRAALVLLDVG